MYFLTVFLLLWLFLMLTRTPQMRARDDQKSVGGFSVTGSGEP